MHLKETMIQTEEIYDGKIFKVTKDTVLLKMIKLPFVRWCITLAEFALCL